VPETVPRKRPVLHPFRYASELRPTAPGSDQEPRPVGSRGGHPGRLRRLCGRSRRWAATSQHATSHPWGQPRRQTPTTPRHALFAKCLWMDRCGSRRLHRWRDRALWRVQTQAQIQTRYQSTARFKAFAPPRLLMRRPRPEGSLTQEPEHGGCVTHRVVRRTGRQRAKMAFLGASGRPAGRGRDGVAGGGRLPSVR
jgi:hypothetical protein